MANRNGLTLIDGSTRYPFTLFNDPKNGRKLSVTSREWEHGDTLSYWKEPLHPWDGGLNSDRLPSPSHYFGSTRTFAPNTYAKANADLSNKGLLIPPPLLNTIAAGSFDITLVGTSSATATNVSSVNFNYPATIRPGDIAFFYVQANDAVTDTIGSTRGFQIGTQQNNGNQHGALLYEVLSGSVTTNTVTYGGTLADELTVICIVYRNVLQSSFVDQTSFTVDNTSPYTTGTITPSQDNCMVIAFTGKISAGAATPNNGFTSQISINGANNSLNISDKLQTTATAVNCAVTYTGGDASGEAIIISIKRTAVSITDPIKFVNFNSKSWTATGTQLLSINSSYTLAIEAVMPASITDLAVFNNELIVGLGASTKIYKATAASPEVFSQATDNTYAVKLAVVGKNLWRSTSNVGVSSCTTTPLTLSNWGTTYNVGNTSWAINCLIDYDGNLWVGKQDGFYTPDVTTTFWNQTPQMLAYPDTNNCVGSFVAKGYLWAPSLPGLLRIRQGESVFKGPELSNRPAMRFHTHSGVEWAGNIYLVCHDHGSVEQTAIIKMIENGDNYIYHEWARLGSTTAAGIIGINIYPTNPSLMVGHGSVIKYIKLGRGGGREIDDANYGYGLSWEIETGHIQPTIDMSLVSGLLGINIVTDQDASETIDTIQYKIEEGSYTNMLTTQEGGGTMPVTNTSGYTSVTRYAASGAQGQFFSFKVAGSMSDAALGTDRPEIREMWAFGYTRPRVVDIIELQIYAEVHALGANMIPQGRDAGEVARLFRAWKRDQTELQIELPEYEASRTIRGRIVAVSDEELLIEPGTSDNDKRTAVLTIRLVRDDFAGAYAS